MRPTEPDAVERLERELDEAISENNALRTQLHRLREAWREHREDTAWDDCPFCDGVLVQGKHYTGCLWPVLDAMIDPLSKPTEPTL
jgi:hypothetical protein